MSQPEVASDNEQHPINDGRFDKKYFASSGNLEKKN